MTGYAPINGKTVYLDKYEITAGRMRAFVDAVTASRGVPDIKGYMAAHRPARWNLAWEAVLPSAYYDTQPGVTYTVSNPTPTPASSGPLFGFLYPGEDVAGTVVGELSSPKTGSFTIWPGLFETFGEEPFFPEYADQHAVLHNLNCSNAASSAGFGTYYLPASGNIHRQFSQAQMDRRALNCTTNAMFAAFCAWDGGQLVTEDVMSYVVGGKISASDFYGNCVASSGSECRIGKANPGGTFNPNDWDCPGLNLSASSSGACYTLAPYEGSPDPTTDDSGRIFPPGAIAADVVRIVAADEGWYDLKGNLLEMVVASDDRFGYNGYGIGYGGIAHHRGQVTTARFKEGSAGARCMRLK